MIFGAPAGFSPIEWDRKHQETRPPLAVGEGKKKEGWVSKVWRGTARKRKAMIARF